MPTPDPAKILPKVTAKMQILQALARRTVVKSHPRRVNRMISSWEICREQDLGITQKDYPVFKRLVLEELRRNNPYPPIVHQSDSDSDAVFSSEPEDEPVKIPTPSKNDDDMEDRVVEELEFPSQIPTPSSPKLPTPKTPTKSASAGKKVLNLKRSKMVAPESPPKSPIIVSNKMVKFGKLPKTSKRASPTIQGRNRNIYCDLPLNLFLAGHSSIIPAALDKTCSDDRPCANEWESSDEEGPIDPLVKDFRQQWNQLVQSRTPEVPARKKTRIA